MRFSADWVAGGENRSPEERATLCSLQILVGEPERNVSAFIEMNAMYEGVLVPAVHLAEGIASNWWGIFGGRDVTHGILPWRTGFALPDLRFEFDGSTMRASCEPLEMANPPLLFPHGGNEYLARDEAEQTLSCFVDEVVAKLHASDVTDSTVAPVWARVQESRADANERAFCEAAGALDSDPYSIPDADARLIESAGALFEGEPLIEFLAGMRSLPRTTDNGAALIRWVTERRPQGTSWLPELSALARQITDAAPRATTRPPWDRGKRAAKAFRDALDVPSHAPVNAKDIAKRLGGTHFRRHRGPSGVFALVAHEDGGQIHVHLRSRGSAAWARSAETFAFARALGDALCFPNIGRSAINHLHRAERQAVGRAFAAEFVAPSQAVLERWDSGQDADEIAGHFGVSSKVVEHTVENAGRDAVP